jgi:hypothetical protein
MVESMDEVLKIALAEPLGTSIGTPAAEPVIADLPSSISH